MSYALDRSGRKTVLLVDDTSDNLALMSELLKEKYKVKTAPNGERALRIAQSDQPPDMILLDIVMPGMDGYEVCRRLKCNPVTAEIPVIFLTAKDQIDDEAFGLSLGAVDYIVKPAIPPILFARIDTQLALSQARTQLAAQNRELIQTARLREDVEQIMRHDLKGPLNVIIGAPQVIMMEDGLSEKQCQFLKMIGDAGYQMLDMINRSLDIYKMENGIYQLCREQVDVFSVLHTVVAELEKPAADKRLRINLVNHALLPEGDHQAHASGERLLCHSTFSNLIKNAVEASASDQAINIHIQAGSTILVSIDNNGEVPETIRPRFFEKFATAGKRHGTGLGTYSAKLMVTTMGGEILLDTSTPGRTRLLVSLVPYDPANEQLLIA